ncbi:MAG: hypothetical protein JWQ91_120 [Aeromicrobium sp.]|uniref:universal stress protein n=1 Tax=Aeromicrobium sp. TaxID=1871063 RepID=UPI002610E33B|nr:universal stress protein [Aeromicrobium sp.]MCW2823203.1 hypothetical protein [Aeromicrobium sp.]
MSHDESRPVVVGVAGRHVVVLQYARQEAERAGCAITLVHAYTVPPSAMGNLYGLDVPEAYKAGGHEVLTEARHELTAMATTSPVHSVLVRGFAPAVLESESRKARLMVIGPDESKPWVARILEGRVARHLVDHAECPVAVVSDTWEPSRDASPVVVIIDDEPLAQGALAFAFGTAELRHVELRILHVAAKMQDEPDGEWSSMKWIVDTWQERFPDVRESSHIVTRDVHAEAVSAGNGAGLLVVGRSRCHGAGSLLGDSLARDIISVSDCPVVVVPSASAR